MNEQLPYTHREQQQQTANAAKKDESHGDYMDFAQFSVRDRILHWWRHLSLLREQNTDENVNSIQIYDYSVVPHGEVAENSD